MADTELTWPPSTTSRYVDLGEQVHYLDFGGPPGAPPVVCVHGLGGSALNFGLLGPRLADARRVLAVDLLGHGRSAPGDPTLSGSDTLHALVDQIGQFVREVAGSPVVLVGHSLGGVMAMQLTLRSPTEVERLVLLDPPVPNRTRRARDRKLVLRLAMLRHPAYVDWSSARSSEARPSSWCTLSWPTPPRTSTTSRRTRSPPPSPRHG